MKPEPLTLEAGAAGPVSGLLQVPAEAQAIYVLAHGAGAGMTHPSMTAVADELAERRIASLRYQFPYMEQRRKRVDPPAVAHAAVRAAVDMAHKRMPMLPLFAGGRSFGGRMTSQAQAAAPLAGVRGLIFLAFPLHPANRPSQERAKHLSDVDVPMLFLQGTRDALAMLDELRPVCESLKPRATLKLFEGADHSFHVPARSGRNDNQVRSEMLDYVATWIGEVSGR
jgi:predicted alpha/beta-hydrolase family hydrolase